MLSGPSRQAGPGRASGLLVPIVAASGFAGLAYEVVWTRMLALALGTEMMAVLGVVTGFFGGLALGAFVLDRVIRRARSARRAYALLEAVIAAWAVASVWVIPAAGRALALLLGTAPTAPLLWAAGFALPALALLPATAAMGGTLVALERLSASLQGQARVAAGVYGANAAGAVAGALCSVFLLLPALGLSRTLATLAAVNAACALAALMLGPAADAEPPTPADVTPGGGIGAFRLAVALLVTGLLGVAVEVLVIRLAAQVLQDTIYSFAFLLAAYLLGTALGSLAWQRAGIVPGPRALTGLLAGTALACLVTAAIARLLGPLALAAEPSGALAELTAAALLFLLPSAAMGALFGCLAQAVRDRRGTLGWAVGVNSLGAAAAAPLTALALIPAFGAWAALLLAALSYLLLCPGPFRRVARAGAAPVAAALALWLAPASTLVRVPPGGALLDVREGATATASVVEDADRNRYLEVNGHFRMGGTGSLRSDWRQAQLPLLLHPAPRRALFLGVGTGATLAGAALPGVAATGVELVPEVIDLLPWFAEQGAPPLPPIVAADARRFVAADTGAYDVVVADLFHPALDGSGALYTTEHFAAVRARLAQGGLFCQWLPLYQLDLPSLRAIIRAFIEIYPNGSAWLAHLSLQTPMLALVGSRGPPHLDLAALTKRLDDPASRPALRRTGLATPMDVLGLHVGGARPLAAFAGPGPRNTDDAPFVTLDARRNIQVLAAPPAERLLTLLRAVSPDAGLPMEEPRLLPLADRLAAYRRARDRFIEAGATLPADAQGRALVDAAAPGLLASVRLSAEFDPAYLPLLGMAQALLSSDRDAGVRLLRATAAAAPSRPEAFRLLGRLAAP